MSYAASLQRLYITSKTIKGSTTCSLIWTTFRHYAENVTRRYIKDLKRDETYTKLYVLRG